MKRKNDPTYPWSAALRDLVAWFDATGVAASIVGGVAVALRGEPRLTQDVDGLIALDEKRWATFVRQGKRFGIVERIPQLLEFARQSHVLLLRHEPSAVDVDLMVAHAPFEMEILDRTEPHLLEGISIPLVSAEDLVVMKAAANRQKDINDIESLLDANPNIDLDRCRKWVETLAEQMDDVQIALNFEQLLRKRLKAKRKPKGK